MEFQRKSVPSQPSPKKRKTEVEVKTTHRIYVLDRMAASVWDRGTWKCARAIKDLPNTRGEDCLLSVFTFDNKHEVVVKGVKAKDYELPEECMYPRGMTSLRDAVSNALEYAGTLDHQVLIVSTRSRIRRTRDSKETIKTPM